MNMKVTEISMYVRVEHADSMSGSDHRCLLCYQNENGGHEELDISRIVSGFAIEANAVGSFNRLSLGINKYVVVKGAR
jgi:hypothetical protein